MIPLRDTIRSRTIPYVNIILIVVCGAVFVYELSLGERAELFIRAMAVTPARIAGTLFQGDLSIREILPLVTSMFLHGGWLHLIGNMVYLYVFGDNVEDALGHSGYLLFYLLAGIAAGLTEVAFRQDSLVPLIGASGAIAGVLGGYFLLFPRARVTTIIPLFIFFPIVELPAYFFLGFWFVMQFLEGTLGAGAADAGVAWWAHAGGFVAGAVLLPFFLLARRL